MPLMSDWLATIIPFVGDAKMSAILREKVGLLETQRDDAIDLLNKADGALAGAKAEVAALRGEIEQLKQQVSRLRPKTDLATDAAKILKYFFEQDQAFSPEHMANHFQLKTSVAKHHFDTLFELELIQYAAVGIMDADEPVEYEISAKGRTHAFRSS
jgi:hypothetical protein